MVQLLDLNKIVNSDYNPRKDFREETLLELSESIRQSGVLQPICVRPKDEGFEIVYGERRDVYKRQSHNSLLPSLCRQYNPIICPIVSFSRSMRVIAASFIVITNNSS